MADTTFNTAEGVVVDRPTLVLYLNTGTTSAPTWSPVGFGVEDSAMAYDWSKETQTDIFGITRTKMRKPVITQEFSPYDLMGGDAAQVKIWNQAIRDQDVGSMANNDMLVVHAYAGETSAAFAERYTACAVEPSELGGSASVGMHISVTFGGTRTTGTAKVADGTVTFTAA